MHSRLGSLLLLLAAYSTGLAVELPPVPRNWKLPGKEARDLAEAEDLLRAGKWRDAYVALGKHIKLYASSPAVPYCQLMRGYCQDRLNNATTAIREYRAVGSWFPDSPEVAFALGWIAKCYERLGKPREGLSYWKLLVEEYPDSLPSLTARWKLAQFYADDKRRDIAAQLCQTIVDQFPPYPPEHEYGEWYRAGEWLVEYYAVKMGDPEAAKRKYVAFRTKYLCQCEKRPEAEARKAAEAEATGYIAGVYRKIANLYREAGLGYDCKKYYDLAVKYYTAANQPVEIAWLRKEFGEHQEAVDMLFEYLSKNEKDDKTRAAFGRYLEELQEWEAAREQYEKMSDRNAALAEIGDSYYREKRFSEALATFNKVLQQDESRRDWALFRIAECRAFGLGDPQGAIPLFERSKYGGTKYLFRIVDCYQLLKKYAQAVDKLKEILEGHADAAPEVFWRLARVFRERGLPGDSFRCFTAIRKIISEYPNSPQAAKAEAFLKNELKLKVQPDILENRSDEEILGF